MRVLQEICMMARILKFGLPVVALVALFAFTSLRAKAADVLTPGTSAPDFGAVSQEDKTVHLSDYKGKWVVLYFYPKDMTTGCTIEAHNFQRDEAKYKAAEAVVLGVSLDTVESHKEFCAKESLTFKLLADTNKEVSEKYDS